jgi:hypothetical protein
MKCKICGITKRNLPTMAEHYRLDHPKAMQRKKFDRAPNQYKGQKKINNKKVSIIKKVVCF